MLGSSAPGKMAFEDSMSARLERGTLLIADLSGYTEYLVRTDIEHSASIVGDLLARIVRSIEPRFRISRVEGDAVFAWAPEATLDASGFFETVDGTYAQFRHRALGVHRATSCRCEACGLVPRLDLKLVAHHGGFVRQSIAGVEELAGRDVIIAHRLLKNSLGFSGPDSGYLLISSVCAEALGLDPKTAGMSPHSETYEHIGEVPGWVTSLHSRWAAAPDWEPSATPLVSFDVAFNAAPDQTWEALAPGRSDSCVSNLLEELTEILEWRPYRRFVIMARHLGLSVVHEAVFEERDGATVVSLRWYPDGAAVYPKQLAAELQSLTEKASTDARLILEVPSRVS